MAELCLAGVFAVALIVALILDIVNWRKKR